MRLMLDPHMPCTCTVAYNYAVWPSNAQLHFNSQLKDGSGSASQAGRPQKLQASYT